MAAEAQFTTTDVSVQPGDAATLSLTLANLGTRTETFTLVPSGLVAGWVRLAPPTVTLFGGTQADIEVTLRPPALATTPAGAAPLTVRIIPQEHPDDVVIAETTVNIGAFHDRKVHVLQPVVRSGRRASYEFLVENQGNSQASCRLHLIDTSQRLDGDFDPPAVGIEPGGTSLVRLRLKAVRRQWARGSRTLPFTIEADQQGFPTASAEANFVQTPVLPEKLGRRFVTLVLLAGALAGAWFGLIRPATRDAARDAVRDFTPTVVSVVQPIGTGNPTESTEVSSETTAPPTTVVDDGDPFSATFRLVVAPLATGVYTYDVPAGQDLVLTDFIFQNVNADEGLAGVRRGEDVVTQWKLEDAYPGHDPVQFVSGYVFPSGSTLTFELRCDAVGPGGDGVIAPTDAGNCIDSLLVSGRLVPAP